MDDTPHNPAPKGGGRIKVNKIALAKADKDGYMTIRVKINDPPKLSASKKCYLYFFKQGESDIVVDCGGKERKMRMTLILYAKVPASERRATLEQEALAAEARGEPKLY